MTKIKKSDERLQFMIAFASRQARVWEARVWEAWVWEARVWEAWVWEAWVWEAWVWEGLRFRGLQTVYHNNHEEFFTYAQRFSMTLVSSSNEMKLDFHGEVARTRKMFAQQETEAPTSLSFKISTQNVLISYSRLKFLSL